MPLAADLFAEPYATALFVVVLGVLIAVTVLLSKVVDHIGIPVVLVLLVLGMLGGSEGIGGIAFADYTFAVRMGTIALVLILFDGGLRTSVASIRQVIGPASVLATLGVLLTAGAVALFARLLGLGWTEAMLLGAVVSSTDAAAVFAVLRGSGLNLQPRAGRTLEVESCINDPMAVILTTTVIAAITSPGPIGLKPFIDVPMQLILGTGVGIGVGYLGRWVLRKARLTTVGLYPALTLSIAFVSFGLATIINGSGFLAVFLTAVVLGNGPLPYRTGLERIHDSVAWLGQIAMFLMLGLLVFPSRLLPVAGVGLAIGLFLAIVARPLAVMLCLLPFRYPRAQAIYVSWIGLRGAVPIILATFPVLAGVPGADRIFDLVFFIVVVSSVVPGATIRYATRKLKMDIPTKPVPAAILEMHAGRPLNGELASYFVQEPLAVCGARLSEIEFPQGAAIILLIRGEDIIAARGNTVLQPGDHVYVFFREEDRPFIELLFGRPEDG